MQPNPTSNAAAARCSRCGAAFHCGRDDAGGCWCAKLPALPSSLVDAAAGCLCEDCLRRALEDAARPRLG